MSRNGLTSLLDLASKSGLARTLAGPGPYTVFAPTNEAFKALDLATQKSIQMDANLLRRVLTYHVVSAGLPPASVKSGLTPLTLSGQKLRIKVDERVIKKH